MHAPTISLSQGINGFSAVVTSPESILAGDESFVSFQDETVTLVAGYVLDRYYTGFGIDNNFSHSFDY